jgi:outer membrane protein
MLSNVWQARIVSIFFAVSSDKQWPEPGTCAENGLGETGYRTFHLVTNQFPKDSLSQVLYRRDLRLEHFLRGIEMIENGCFPSLRIRLVLCCLVIPVQLAAQSPQAQKLLKDYSKGPGWVRNFTAPYKPQVIPPISLENSPRIENLIHDGKLELSLADALALAIENNLDISVQRQVVPMAQTDLLRTQAGSAARGFSGATIPLGLSAGALGLGVSTAVAGGGVGNAGGITGGGGAVDIPPVGTFDPTINFNFSWDRTTAPLNTTVVAGVPAVTAYSTSYSGSYTQLLPSGTSYFVSLNGLRSSSTQQSLLFNPAVATRMSVGFNQPLLSGLGLKPNQRFLLVARNNEKISGEIFRNQLTQTIVQVENAYWDMAQFQENVKVAEQSLAAAQRLYEDNKIQVDIGALTRLDVVSAQSAVAASERDLVVARTNLQIQETQLKNILSKRMDPDLEAAQIVTTDLLPEPRNSDIPALQEALADAYRNRTDLQIAEVNVQNEEISTQFTANNLLPTGNIFSQYAAAGLQGNCIVLGKATCNSTSNPPPGTLFPAGVGGSLSQMIDAAYPEQSVGLSLILPIKNRAAQADNLRAQLETQQTQISLQRLRNQVELTVRQAMIGLVQGKAQVEAAHQAVLLAQQVLDAEQQKLALGASTSYTVILRQRDLTTAQYAEVQAVDAYAKALVAMNQARGGMLERNGMTFDDALRGIITKAPAPPFNGGFTPGGR